jgi:hypothetical protein
MFFGYGDKSFYIFLYFLQSAATVFGFFYFKKLLNEKYKIEFFCFLQKKTEIQADPCIFVTVHRHKLTSIENW